MNLDLRTILLFFLAMLSVQLKAQDVRLLSFEEALQLLHNGNQSLTIADKGIEIARNERDKIRAYWYPRLQSTGAFVHLSEKVEVKQPLSEFTDPTKEFVHSILPDDELISGILDRIGSHTLVFPLAPRNVTTVDVTAEWVLFSGGKRFMAGKIGNAMVDIARRNRAQVDAAQRILLTESYYGLGLAQQVVSVREESCRAFEKHYENALKLEANGMIDKAGRLFAQVNRDEAKRELEAARKDESVLQSALAMLLNREVEEGSITPSSPLFINDSLPPKATFIGAVATGNDQINRLYLQEQMAKQQIKIDQSGYMPNIALFGKQTLYAHGIQSNLLPRTMVGIGFTWNLFDGLEREKRIRQSKLTRQSLVLGQSLAKDELTVGVDKWYSMLQKAQDNVRTLGTTIQLSEELVRMRKKAFEEGMATSTEVIDSQILLAKVKVAQLAAYYEYDVALMNLLALCGTPEYFTQYMINHKNTP